MKNQIRYSVSMVVAAMVCHSTNAADLGLEFEVGIGHSDNITRAVGDVSDPAIDDTIYSAALAMTLEHQSARSDVDARGSVYWHDYADGPYDSETLPALDATALLRVSDQALSWFVQANVGQQSVDPFEPVTPENRENISYVTTGPILTIGLGSRFSLRMDAWYSDIDYEVQPFDNQRVGAQVGLLRQMSPTRTLSLNYRTEETDFQWEQLLPQIDREDVFLEFATEGSRSELAVELGVSRSERLGEKSDEPLAIVEWRRQVSPSTSMTISGGTRISDAADSFRNAQQDSLEIGDVQVQNDIPDPFKERFGRLSLEFTAARTLLVFGGQISENEYSELLSQQNLDSIGIFAVFNRQLGRSWRAGLSSMWNQRKYSALERTDDEFDAGFNVIWQGLRSIDVEVRFDRYERGSTDPTPQFTENRIYLGFRYLPFGRD